MNNRGFINSLMNFRSAFALVSAAVLISLVAWTAHAEESTRQVQPPNERLHIQTEGNLKITTAVPSADEAQDIFGVNLYSKNVQPVWVQVENLGDVDMWLLPVGLDAAYYTPLETASRQFSLEKLLQTDADLDFRQRKMARMIEPGMIRSGYIFSRVDEGTKTFNVDIVPLGKDPYRMTFFVPVPGLRLDHYETEFNEIYASDEIIDVDLQGLIDGLEAYPCCVTDAKGENFGDPLNIAFVGETDDLYYSFLRAGWDETETIYKSSLWKMMKSSLAGSDYRYSPVSALYVQGRAQDIALQRTRESINQRNHFRLWMTPMRFEGQPVWIGQISRDIGVRFTKKTITTHKIDANVDETREFLLEDLFYAQALSKVGYVKGVGVAPYEEPRGNLTGDPYFTDGLRVVMWVSDSPKSLSELEVLDLGARPQAGK
jgi:hypothetical protein